MLPTKIYQVNFTQSSDYDQEFPLTKPQPYTKTGLWQNQA
jgi:hypothetical protein